MLRVANQLQPRLQSRGQQIVSTWLKEKISSRTEKVPGSLSAELRASDVAISGFDSSKPRSQVAHIRQYALPRGTVGGVAISPLTPSANPSVKPITQHLFGYRCALGCCGGRRSSARCPQPYNGPCQRAACGGGGGINWSSCLHESEESRRVAEVPQGHRESSPRTQPRPDASLRTHRVTRFGPTVEQVDHAASRCEER